MKTNCLAALRRIVSRAALAGSTLFCAVPSASAAGKTVADRDWVNDRIADVADSIRDLISNYVLDARVEENDDGSLTFSSRMTVASMPEVASVSFTVNLDGTNAPPLAARAASLSAASPSSAPVPPLGAWVANGAGAGYFNTDNAYVDEETGDYFSLTGDSNRYFHHEVTTCGRPFEIVDVNFKDSAGVTVYVIDSIAVQYYNGQKGLSLDPAKPTNVTLINRVRYWLVDGTARTDTSLTLVFTVRTILPDGSRGGTGSRGITHAEWNGCAAWNAFVSSFHGKYISYLRDYEHVCEFEAGSCVCKWYKSTNKTKRCPKGDGPNGDGTQHVLGSLDGSGACRFCIRRSLTTAQLEERGERHLAPNAGCNYSKNVSGCQHVHSPEKEECGCDCGHVGAKDENDEPTAYSFHKNTQNTDSDRSCWCRCGAYHTGRQEAKFTYPGGTHGPGCNVCTVCKGRYSAWKEFEEATEEDHMSLAEYVSQGNPYGVSRCGCVCGLAEAHGFNDSEPGGEEFHIVRMDLLDSLDGFVLDQQGESSCWCFCGKRHRKQHPQEGQQSHQCIGACEGCSGLNGDGLTGPWTNEGNDENTDIDNPQNHVLKRQASEGGTDGCGCSCGRFSPEGTEGHVHNIDTADCAHLHVLPASDDAENGVYTCTCMCDCRYHIPVKREDGLCDRVCGLCGCANVPSEDGSLPTRRVAQYSDHDPAKGSSASMTPACGCACFAKDNPSGEKQVGFGFAGADCKKEDGTPDPKYHVQGEDIENPSKKYCCCQCNLIHDHADCQEFFVAGDACPNICSGFNADEQRCGRLRSGDQATYLDHTPATDACGCQCHAATSSSDSPTGYGGSETEPISGEMAPASGPFINANAAYHVRKAAVGGAIYCCCDCGTLSDHAVADKSDWFVAGTSGLCPRSCKGLTATGTICGMPASGGDRTQLFSYHDPKAAGSAGCGCQCGFLHGPEDGVREDIRFHSFVGSNPACWCSCHSYHNMSGGSCEGFCAVCETCSLSETLRKEASRHTLKGDGTCTCKCEYFTPNGRRANATENGAAWKSLHAEPTSDCKCPCASHVHFFRSGCDCPSVCAVCTSVYSDDGGATELPIGTGPMQKPPTEAHEKAGTSDFPWCGCRCGVIMANDASVATDPAWHYQARDQYGQPTSCWCFGAKDRTPGAHGSWHYDWPNINGCTAICGYSTVNANNPGHRRSTDPTYCPNGESDLAAAWTDHTPYGAGKCGCRCQNGTNATTFLCSASDSIYRRSEALRFHSGARSVAPTCLCPCGRYHMNAAPDVYGCENICTICSDPDLSETVRSQYGIPEYGLLASSEFKTAATADDHTPSGEACSCLCGLIVGSDEFPQFHCFPDDSCYCLEGSSIGMPNPDLTKHHFTANKCTCDCGLAYNPNPDHEFEDGHCYCTCNDSSNPEVKKHRVLGGHVQTSSHNCRCQCGEWHIPVSGSGEEALCPSICRGSGSFGSCSYKKVSFAWDERSSYRADKYDHMPKSNGCGCRCGDKTGASYPDPNDNADDRAFHNGNGAYSCRCSCGAYHNFSASDCPSVCSVCKYNLAGTVRSWSIHTPSDVWCGCRCGQYDGVTSGHHVWSDSDQSCSCKCGKGAKHHEWPPECCICYCGGQENHIAPDGGCMCQCGARHVGFESSSCPRICAVCGLTFGREDGKQYHTFDGSCTCNCRVYTIPHEYGPKSRSSSGTYVCDVCNETIAVYSCSATCLRGDDTMTWTEEEGHNANLHGGVSEAPNHPTEYCEKHHQYYGAGSQCPVCAQEDEEGGSGGGSGEGGGTGPWTDI